MIKKITYFPLIFILTLVVSVQSVSAENQKKELRIGAVLPVTGDYAQYGKELWRGMELASTEISEKGTPIKVILEDSATMVATSAVSAANKLVKIDGVQTLVVLGSDDVQPLIGLGKNSDVSILSLWDNSYALEQMGDFVFSNGFSLEGTASLYANYALNTLKLKRVAIIGNNTTWSTTITAAFRKEFEANGGVITFIETFDDTWTDFRSLIPRILKANPEFIFLPLSLPGGVLSFVRQLRENNISLPIFTGEAFVGDTMKQLGSLAEGIYVGWLPEPVGDLARKYKLKYGSEPWDTGIVEVGFSGVQAIFQATQSAKNKPVKEALSMYYGPSRRADRHYILHRVEMGELVAVK